MNKQPWSRPATAALLSALLPGLGQFYNGHWGKGAGFLAGLIILGQLVANGVDLESLQSVQDTPPQNVGQLLILLLLLFSLAVWSIIDATRAAKKA